MISGPKGNGEQEIIRVERREVNKIYQVWRINTNLPAIIRLSN